jgi:glycogen operon protein
MLRRGLFLTGAYDDELGVRDVSWLTPAATEMTEENWNDGNARCLGVLLDGRAQETGIRRVGSDSTLLIVVNSHTDVVAFTLPEAVGGSRWVRLIDSSDPNGEPLALRDFGHAYDVPSRALLFFLLQPTRTRDRATAAERSFQRVVQTMDDASTRSVRFGFD